VYAGGAKGTVAFDQASRGARAGAAQHGESGLPTDLSAREIGILVPLAVVCLAIGFYPKPMLEAIAPSVELTLKPYPALVRTYVAEGTLLPAAATTDSVALGEAAFGAAEQREQTDQTNDTR
jgi:hypothetical protein